MRWAAALVVTAGGLALALWFEDPFIQRDATLARMLSRSQTPDCKP